jgi:hypothetical protein
VEYEDVNDAQRFSQDPTFPHDQFGENLGACSVRKIAKCEVFGALRLRRAVNPKGG